MKDPYLEEDLQGIAKKISAEKELFQSRIFVTGGTGLVGSEIVRALLKMNEMYDAGITVCTLVRKMEKAKAVYREEAENPSLEFVIGDLEKPLEVDGEIDYIIHTASPTASKFFVDHPVETLSIAIDGTRHVLELAKEKKSKGVVYLSSMEAFGITDPNLTSVKEDDLGYIDIHHVRSSYSEGKRVCELLCSCYAAEYGVPVRIARLAQTFGAGIPYEENRVFAQFAKSAIHKEDIVLHTDGMSVGNYCYTSEAVEAILLLLVKGENGQAYTVANEASNTTIRGMAEMVAEKIAHNEIKVIFDIPKDSLTYGYAPAVKIQLNSQKLRALGWEPKIGLEESYRRMIASMLATKEA